MFKVKSYSYNTSLIYFVHTFRRCVGCKNSDISPLQPPTTAMPMTSCKTPEEDAFYKKYKAECEQIAPVCPTYNQPTQEMGVSTRDFELELDELAEADVDSEHLLAFINRYKDIGGQLYRMFHDRLNEVRPHLFSFTVTFKYFVTNYFPFSKRTRKKHREIIV